MATNSQRAAPGGAARAAAPAVAAPQTWSPLARRVASLLIILHLAAVFIAPFAFAGRTDLPSSSPFADGLLGWFRPYIDLMYLNHGYSFFAPQVGASHLVHYRIDYGDGRQSVEGTFPDLKSERPRLLYHRHFMLAEALNNAFVPPEEPAEPRLDPAVASALSDAQRRALEANYHQRQREQLALWKHGRSQYEALRRSMERHLAAVHGGGRVTLTRVEHRPIFADEFEVLGKLDAPHTYVKLPEVRPARTVQRP